MRCLVTDLDRTLTGPDLALDRRAVDRIRALRTVGVLVVIATGRRAEEVRAMGLLAEVDGLVAENGAVVVAQGETHVVDPAFRTRAQAAVADARFHWGRVVGSGPRERARDAGMRLRAAGIEHALEFNAEEVMVLPPGVSKATGAARCLAAWGLEGSDAWAIGDGENDVALLAWASHAGAPSNAHPKARAAAEVQLEDAYADAFLAFTKGLLAPRPPGARPA